MLLDVTAGQMKTTSKCKHKHWVCIGITTRCIELWTAGRWTPIHTHRSIVECWVHSRLVDVPSPSIPRARHIISVSFYLYLASRCIETHTQQLLLLSSLIFPRPASGRWCDVTMTTPCMLLSPSPTLRSTDATLAPLHGDVTLEKTCTLNLFSVMYLVSPLYSAVLSTPTISLWLGALLEFQVPPIILPTIHTPNYSPFTR